MLTRRSFFYSFFYTLLKFPLRLFVRCKLVADNLFAPGTIVASKPIFYVIRNQSASDLLALQIACKQQQLPDPLGYVKIHGNVYPRSFCLEKPTSVLPWRTASKTLAIALGRQLLEEHAKDPDLDAQLVPANLIWGRTPTKEADKANVGTILADQESPTWLRKFFIVLFLGRYSLVRFSKALSFRYMVDQHGSDEATATKFMRVARFHFHRQTIAATGPRLMHRQQMFTALFANASIKRLISDEAKTKGISKSQVKKQALAMMDEIAGDYRESVVRFGERMLSRLWRRLYSSIEIQNGKVLRDLAQDGHEIIYIPCHRSHMDYLLLTYVIFHEGLVTPRIAAGINLNFWPAGPFFRKAGAFFMRRSFGGNRLYSAIFREYLGLLFERGYSVKYYTEGGRSRTGRLLPPKTGMLAMTIQSLLRGIDRPLTIVPVYLGYEHVMEVGSYHKELSGSEKKKESIFGVMKAIKNLRNYGKGYVNFGQPISINGFLNEQVPNWKDAINPVDPQKPSWLTPSVNVLADRVMTEINKSAALNGVSLVALILHATENKALAQAELEAQLDFFLSLQRQAPFSEQLTIPPQSATELLAQVIALGKVTVSEDSFGNLISLTGSSIIEMRYYRNNILHAYVIPALICRLLERSAKLEQQALTTQVQNLVKLVKKDLFLWPSEQNVKQQVSDILDYLIQQNIVSKDADGFFTVTQETQLRAKLSLMGQCIDETIQRLTIISTLVSRLAPISKAALEDKVVAIAKRLSVLNNINAPEFIDKKAQATLINAMKEQGYIGIDEQGSMVESSTLLHVKTCLTNLVDIDVLQSIAR